MRHRKIEPVLLKTEYLGGLLEVYFFGNSQILKDTDFGIQFMQAVHFVEAYFHNKILAFKGGGTASRNVMTFQQQHFFARTGQGCPCGQSANTPADDDD